LLQIDGETPEEKAERLPLVFALSSLLEGNIGIQGLLNLSTPTCLGLKGLVVVVVVVEGLLNFLPFLMFPPWVKLQS
jgi:hypothetical protein